MFELRQRQPPALRHVLNEMLPLTDGPIDRVINIVCSSRSGSSLFKEALSRLPGVITLAGEEEPYWRLSGNGYRLTGYDDSFTNPANPELMRRLIADELYEENAEKRWRKRLLMQFGRWDGPIGRWADLSWLGDKIGYYDGYRRPWDRFFKLEEPPFVLPKPYENPRGKALVLKTPQNVYRPGALEKVFPNIEIEHIYLTRNFASTINGLIDGWYCDFGFFAHPVPTHRGWRWWKFDMPPGWSFDMSIEERAMFQWRSAHLWGLSYWKSAERVKFEDLLVDPAAVVNDIGRKFNLGQVSPKSFDLPSTMTTDQPAPFRWVRRKQKVLRFQADAKLIMERLGYKMEPETWL